MVKAEGEGRNLLGSKNVNVAVIDALQQNEGRRKRRKEGRGGRRWVD